MSKDIFEKCNDFKNMLRAFLLNDAEMSNINSSLDLTKEEDLDYLAYDFYVGGGPINNGGPTMTSENGEHYYQFSTNDYLGLSQNKDIHDFSVEFMRKYTIGSPMGSRLLSGSIPLHRQFEAEIAEFKKTEECLTFSTGANAMLGAVACLADKEDLLILDQLAHASLNCGAKISGAEIKRFKHNDLNELEDILKKSDSKKGKLIVIDGVYSMTGDIAPLKEICDLKDKYGGRLFMDDAHGNGVLGINGGGLAELEGLEERIDVQAGTFSKAFGSNGGFIAANRNVIEFIGFWAPTLMFTKAPSALTTAVNMKALEIIKSGYRLRKKLYENTSYLQNKLLSMGFDLGDTCTPISPITFSGHIAIYLCYELRNNYGIWVSPVVYPAIPLGKSVIRVISTILHTKEHMDYFCESLCEAYNKVAGKPIDVTM